MRKAQIEVTKEGILILCNLRHLLEFIPNKESFAGGNAEANLTFRYRGDRFDRAAERCRGYGHDPIMDGIWLEFQNNSEVES